MRLASRRAKIRQALRQDGLLRTLDRAALALLRSLLPFRWFMFLFDFDNWHRGYVIDRTLRVYLPGAQRIADVGGGWGNLARLVRARRVVVVEPDATFARAASEVAYRTIRARGESLPLRKGAVDATVSVHALEHVPARARRGFIAELMRVSRMGVILLGPEGRGAERLCEDMVEDCRVHGVAVSPFTLEHLAMGVPRGEDVVDAFAGQPGVRIRTEPMKNLSADRFLFRMWYRRWPVISIPFLPIASAGSFLLRHRPPHTEMLFVVTRGSNDAFSKRQAGPVS
jgi:hypothetical protein